MILKKRGAFLTLKTKLYTFTNPNVFHFPLQKLVAGTTALCALYRPVEKRVYVAWVGDSKAMLVSQNRILQIVTPHKPSTAVST